MKENLLYPLKFMPILKERIWGGDNIHKEFGFNLGDISKCGEAWMLSGFGNDDSVVANGFLQGNTLSEIVEVYMGELVGEKVYQKFGCLFPLLFKWIDANDDLSVQVHPNDALALEREDSLGKTEMWYMRKAKEGARLICGFKDGVDRQIYREYLEKNKIESVLKSESVKTGDVFYIPAGTVHALRAGLLVAEIQEASDITYRLFDWNRLDANGKSRELHIEKAEDALYFEEEASALNQASSGVNCGCGAHEHGHEYHGHAHDEHCGCHGDHAHAHHGSAHHAPAQDMAMAGKLEYRLEKNKSNLLVNSEFFTVNNLLLSSAIEKDFSELDSFVVYMCNAGSAIIKAEDKAVEISSGELVLVPSCMESIAIYPDKMGVDLLETYIMV